jgi:hypothetical protein
LSFYIGKRLVLVQRYTCDPFDVLEIFHRHLGNGDRDFHTVHFMKVDLAIFQRQELGLDTERF